MRAPCVGRVLLMALGVIPMLVPVRASAHLPRASSARALISHFDLPIDEELPQHGPLGDEQNVAARRPIDLARERHLLDLSDKLGNPSLANDY